MGLSTGFGKKEFQNESQTDFPLLPENGKCGCGSDVVKLEFMIGPDYKKGKKVFYDLCWILMCSECSKQFKKIESSVERKQPCTDPGKGSLRWE